MTYEEGYPAEGAEAVPPEDAGEPGTPEAAGKPETVKPAQPDTVEKPEAAEQPETVPPDSVETGGDAAIQTVMFFPLAGRLHRPEDGEELETLDGQETWFPEEEQVSLFPAESVPAEQVSLFPETPDDADGTVPQDSGGEPHTESWDAGSRAGPPPIRRRYHRTGRGRAAHRRNRRRGLAGFLIGVLCAGALAVGARYWEQRQAARERRDGVVWDTPNAPREELWTEEPEGVFIPLLGAEVGDVTFTLSPKRADSLTAQDIYRTVNPSVVTVVVGISETTSVVGTGVIFTPDGYFITNYHVVDGGQDCYALLDDGRRYNALYVAGDETSDLAILKMECEEEMATAEFGDSDEMVVGDTVYAIGNPLGLEFRGTLTNGIISGTSRDVAVGGRTMNLIQTNAALNTGNSGGPLINEFGQVVGINVVKMSSTRSSVEGLGFAIPTAQMERLLNDLLVYGEAQPEPLIGVTVMSMADQLEDALWGIKVLSVAPDTPAAIAGVQVGDYVLAADGKETRTSHALLRARSAHHIGEELQLSLWREGRRLEVTLTLNVPV